MFPKIVAVTFLVTAAAGCSGDLRTRARFTDCAKVLASLKIGASDSPRRAMTFDQRHLDDTSAVARTLTAGCVLADLAHGHLRNRGRLPGSLEELIRSERATADSNVEGLVRDGWGSAFSLQFGGGPEIVRSAGADRTLGTRDDVIFK